MEAATAPKTATFVTKRPGLTLVIVPERGEIRDAHDRVLAPRRPRQAIQFTGHTDPQSEDGDLTVTADTVTESCVPCEGDGNLIKDGEVIDCPKCEGEGTRTRSVTRANGAIVDLPYEQVLSLLRNHDKANNRYGFWELGNAPDEPLPRSADQIAAIVKASIDLDLDAINETLALERETQDRREIIAQAEAAAEQIKAAKGPTLAEASAATSDVFTEPADDTAPPAEGEGAGQTAEAEAPSTEPAST
jgi:hypothetical protein